MSGLREECGVFGVYAKERYALAHTVYYGLFSLQHRGQESCGIVVNDDGVLSGYKDLGIVNDVFTNEVLNKLSEGEMALGHVRYGTTGTNDRLNAQPITVNHIKGSMALAHNGNLVNSHELRSALELQGSIFQTTSDTEVIAYLITKERLTTNSIEDAVNSAMHKIKGAYCLVIMSSTKLIAARDEHGFRPLCYGVKEDGTYIVASESCALDAVSAKFVRDIEPGEIVVFDNDGVRSIRDHCKKNAKSLCIFEYIYFARPDSVIDGVSVHSARIRAGRCLAQDYPVEADVVVGVPDSGLDAAVGYSLESGIPYDIGFIKNKYIGRTFIAPGQKAREDLVKIKLNVVKEVVEGKRVVLVDDSIVRGTTCARIVSLLKEAGAKEVHMRVSAPPFLNPCYYGTDIDTRENLIAVNHEIEEIRKMTNVESLGYMKIDRLPEILGEDKDMGFCNACFSGDYPTETPVQVAKFKFEQRISERG
ncbi:MAG: amidophosphoribosyltransferase [Peptostreptococcaceae bacterium]|nr:amidophosphoribosyltransferase [Peptostreptococcaceae bacterium]